MNNCLASHLLISPLPKAAHEENDRYRGLQVGADGLDVDEELATLTGLDNRDPQHRRHHQHQHKHPGEKFLQNIASLVFVQISHGLTHLPTTISSHSVERDRKVFHTSMVKIVLALLKMEVREDMRAAIITAIINPRSPGREGGHSVFGKTCDRCGWAGGQAHLLAAAPWPS